MKFDFEEGDRVVCAFAQKADGAGWANWPLWVIIRDRGGELREECLQPDEQTSEMQMLYKVSDVITCEMTKLVQNSLVRKNDPEQQT